MCLFIFLQGFTIKCSRVYYKLHLQFSQGTHSLCWAASIPGRMRARRRAIRADASRRFRWIARDRTGLELDENPMNMVSNRDLPEFHKILRMNIWAYSWIYIIYIRWLVDDCRRSYYPIGDYDHPLTGNSRTWSTSKKEGHLGYWTLLCTHRIHGAGIYANMTGVYWWDPCYHI